VAPALRAIGGGECIVPKRNALKWMTVALLMFVPVASAEPATAGTLASRPAGIGAETAKPKVRITNLRNGSKVYHRQTVRLSIRGVSG
jgi:hypothetical protein